MHKIKTAEVVERFVMGLEATASGLRTLPIILDGISPDIAKDWDDSITASIKQITLFRNQLRNHHGC